jgi:hypothetical protein
MHENQSSMHEKDEPMHENQGSMHENQSSMHEPNSEPGTCTKTQKECTGRSLCTFIKQFSTLIWSVINCMSMCTCVAKIHLF